MRAISVLAVALTGCIDRIELGLELPAEARTVLIRTREGRLYALSRGSIDLVSQDEPAEAVFLAQSIEELQLEEVAAGDPSAPRRLPQPNLGAWQSTGVDEGRLSWMPADPTIRLPEFRPSDCSSSGCAEGEWEAEWCNTTCTPAAPDLPAPPGVSCDACDTARPPPQRCPPGEARFSIGAACAPLSDCAGEFPAGSIFVRPGASGGDGTRARPFGTIDEAIAVGAVIALEPGIHPAPESVRDVQIRGVCASETMLDGDLAMIHAALERVTVLGSILMAAGSTISAATIDGGIFVSTGSARLSAISSGASGAVALQVAGGRLTGDRIALEGSVGVLCSSGAEVELSDVLAEIDPSDGIGASAGLFLDGSCTVGLARAFFRGGQHGIFVTGPGLLDAEDVELRELEGAAVFADHDATLRDVRIYDSFSGVSLGAGTFDMQDLTIVRSGAAITSISSNSSTISTIIHIDRAVLRDNIGGGLRVLNPKAQVDVSDLIVDCSGLPDVEPEVWARAIELDPGAKATIARTLVVDAGTIDIHTDRAVRIRDLTVERTRDDIGLLLRGTDVVVERARVSVRASINDTGITIGTGFDAALTSVELHHVEVSGSIGQGLNVLGGRLLLRAFRIAGFTNGVLLEVDPIRLDARGGVIEGNTIGVGHIYETIPRLFDTRFRDNTIDFQLRGDPR